MISLRKKKNTYPEKAIREACNNLPIGICMATGSGIPRLTNYKMQELARVITGTHLANAEIFWKDLEAFQRNGRVSKIDFTDTPSVRFRNGQVINFTRKEIVVEGMTITEILAMDVTEQYLISRQIAGENDHLRQKTEQLSELMTNIASINRDQEVLESKMRVHYELGRVVLANRQYLMGGGETAKEELLEMWDEVLMSFENPLFSEKTSFDMLAELRSMAKNNGCDLKFEGKIDTDNDLVIEIIREGLVNAVRHGKATEVTVAVQKKPLSDTSVKCNYMVVDNGIGFNKTEMRQGVLKSLELKLAEHEGTLLLYNRTVNQGCILEATFVEHVEEGAEE